MFTNSRIIETILPKTIFQRGYPRRRRMEINESDNMEDANILKDEIQTAIKS
jgi:hypothetical protein